MFRKGVLAGALVLAGCGDDAAFKHEFTDAERDEIADVAADTAYDTVLEHEKVQDLESRIAELEGR